MLYNELIVTADPKLPPYSMPGSGDYGNIDQCNEKNKYFQIEAIPGSLPMICKIYYVIIIWSRRTTELLGQYNDLMKSDYDGKFEWYAKYLVKTAYDRIKKVAEDEGAKYFDCDVYEKVTCCYRCFNIFRDKNPESQCRYCQPDDGGGNICRVVPGSQWGDQLPYE